jgi:trimethylamine:corrinoid methyltransferase-like protein
MNMWTNNWQRLELISTENVEAIDATALRILEEVGHRIVYEPTLKLLRDAGLKVDGDLVHFDRGFVREALARAPSSFKLRARNPGMGFVVGGNHMVNSPTGGAPFVSDLDGGRRPGNVEDYIKLVKAAHMSPQIHCIDSGIVETMDLPQETRHLDMDYLVMRYSDKPLMIGGGSYETSKDGVEMAAILFGGYLTATDMALGQPTLGSPEWAMGILAGAQMARHYGLPFRGAGGWSSAKTVDAQSGYETVMGVWPALLSGTNFMLHAAGALESTMIISAEKMIMDFEVLRMFEWMLDPGLPVSDDTLAFDAIAKAGPGGMYLASSHTRANFRSALYRSELASLEDVNLWTEQGSKDTLVRANERYKGILEAYEDPGLDDAIDAELQEFMAKRKSAIETSTGGD